MTFEDAAACVVTQDPHVLDTKMVGFIRAARSQALVAFVNHMTCNNTA